MDQEHNESGPRNPARAVSDEVYEVLQGKSFASLDEVNAFLAEYMRERNQRPMADFQGISAAQMQCLLSLPFDSPQLVTFAATPVASLEAPIMRLCAMLAEAIGERGLKPTTTGNLPRNLVRVTALTYWGEARYRENTQFGDLRTEMDFNDLHITRLVAWMAGLIRKYQGKFIVSQKYRKLSKKMGQAGLYPLLLRVYAMRFNWAYNDGWFDDLPIIQHTFLFTAFLLQRFGEQWRETSFYEEAFLKAFPLSLDQVAPHLYGTPEFAVQKVYTSRALHQFAVLLGLAEMRPVGEPREYRYKIRKLPLLDEAIRFTL
jgi:hypothetical protein